MSERVLRPLELHRVFAADAAGLAQARHRAHTMHHTSNIRAAGDAVEVPARQWLEDKLGRSYHVGHGHVVDSRLRVSPQLDVVVSSNDKTAVLMSAEDGLEYLPYECVYAVGEVKATYDKSAKLVQKFSDTLRAIQEQLHRERTLPNYLPGGVVVGDGFKVDVGVPHRNPLFSFMLFVDKGDFKVDDLLDHYRSTPTAHLPNVVCILNEGVIANVRVDRQTRQVRSINVNPVFGIDAGETTVDRWTLLRVGTEGERPGYTLAALFLLLSAQVSRCLLMPPDMQRYLNNIFCAVTHTGESLT